VNYAKASELAELVKRRQARAAAVRARRLRVAPRAALLSERGTVAIDVRTNTLLVSDTSRSLENIRRLVQTLDIPIARSSIETRVVIVNDDYSRGPRRAVRRDDRKGQRGERHHLDDGQG